MNKDDLINNLSPSINLTPDNIENKTPKLQKLQTLLQRYQALKRQQEALDEHKKAIERNKELKHFIKEWRYNRDNPDPDVDLGNGKILRTLWKAAPEDDDKK